MVMVKDALERLIDGLRSLPGRRTKGPRVVTCRPGSSDHNVAPSVSPVTISVATFNAAMFSIAPTAKPPATSDADEYPPSTGRERRRRQPTKSILNAQRPPSSTAKQLRVSINLQDDVITAAERSRGRSSAAAVGSMSSNGGGPWMKGKAVVAEEARSAGRSSLPAEWRRSSSRRTRSVAEVLQEVGADIIGLQNVRAKEERGMRPLSDLADDLGMRYVFAESWAPEYGNAACSPAGPSSAGTWKDHRVADHSDSRVSSEAIV